MSCKQLGKTGIYMRLSRDDDKAGESMSIDNQRIILQKYVEEHGGTVIDEYIDDGWSGTNFDRPNVKRMLADAQSGRIDTIVVKDLSRFGRNYIQVGQYIDYIFPAYGIRFIAISDNIDTLDGSSTAMDMMPIMNVFNEWHAANTSKKIRAVLEAKQRLGKYTNWTYSYGYKPSTDENRTALVDEEAAKVVRRMFELRVEGRSANAIARILTDDGIPNPTHHFRKLDGGKWNRPCKPYWCASTVMGILSNPIYIGTMIQHKTTSVSYKNHKLINIPACEQIVKENAHEPIISRELWDKVQKINSSVSRGKMDKTNKVHVLSGLLVCPDCGRKFKLKSSNKSYINSDVSTCSFCCRTYVDLGKKYCSSHSITEKEIESIVLLDIQSMLTTVTIDEEKARANFITAKAKSNEQNRYSDEKQIKVYKSRLAEIDKLVQTAFEDRVLNNMPESVYVNLCAKYQNERMVIETEITKIENRLAEPNNEVADVDEYIRRLKTYGRCETLTREMCLQLIHFITVGEKNKIDGGREIHIYYQLMNS